MKQNNTNNTKEELTETIFKMIEDVGYTENLIEEIKKETQSIRETLKIDSSNIDKINSMQYNISLIQEEQVRQAKVIASIPDNDFNLVKNEIIDDSQLSNLTNKIQKIEQDLKTLKNSQNENFSLDDFSNLNENMKQKLILKQEIRRWQNIIIGILIFLAIDSLFFFGFVFNKQSSNIGLLIFIASIFPFCGAIYLINDNLKKLISEDKRIAKNPTKHESKKIKNIEDLNSKSIKPI